MAKQEKYRYTFKSAEGQTCVVRFYFEGWAGSSTTLIGADKPFTLQEFNTDEDLFKPVRPQLATMNIIASASGITIDDFLMDKDDDIVVYFDFGIWGNYWIGYLQQDDFQETWIDTDHIITLTASEGIGLLSEKMWSYFNAEPSERYTFLQGIEAAMDGTVQSFAEYYVFSSLYHDSMANYGNATTGLDQCAFDGRTFMENPTIYTNSLDVLNKINQAWNQNIFMYKGKWVILRVSDQFIPITSNLQGYAQGLMGRTNISRRYDALVGVDELVKPISTEMLRFINRRYKIEESKFEFEDVVEIIPNQSFTRGDYDFSTSTRKTYEIDSWTLQEGINGNGYPDFQSPTTSSVDLRRYEDYDSQYSTLIDTYANFPAYDTTSGAKYRWMRSTQIDVKAGEKINFSFDAKVTVTPTDDGDFFFGAVLFYGVGYKYTLKETGEWVLSDATWSDDLEFIKMSVNQNGSPITTEWNTLSVESNPLPLDGYIQIVLINDYHLWETNQNFNFRNVEFGIISRFNTLVNAQLESLQSKYESTDMLRNKFDNELYFQDGFSYHYKGSIFESNETALTDKQWFRKGKSEKFSFARQYLTSHWINKRFNRNKIDANFYGLTWDSGNEPIGLINTIRFIDDDPDKVYAILNLKEIDFANSTWTATLLEIFDENKDNAEISKTFDADATTGNYIPTGEFIIPWTTLSAADFTYDSLTKKYTYNGGETLTNLFVATLTGDINTVNPSLPNVTFRLYINEIQVDSTTHDASTTPSEFSIDLGGTYTISEGDTLYMTISGNVGDFDVNGGELRTIYTTTATEDFDPFTEQYIFK